MIEYREIESTRHAKALLRACGFPRRVASWMFSVPPTAIIECSHPGCETVRFTLTPALLHQITTAYNAGRASQPRVG